VATAAATREGVAGLLPRLPIAQIVEPERLNQVVRMTDQMGWPRATGAGRVFEAAGALLGLAAVNGWEGDAAARLESLAARCGDSVGAWEGVAPRRDGGTIILPGAALLAEAARRADAGEDPARIAMGFHVTFSRLAAIVTVGVVPRDVRTIALGGGCFVNRILLATLTTELRERGFEVLRPSALPPGDGGLSYGQAVVASVSLARGVEPRRIDGDE
jgi:hydrogenase maturation protein HypF